MRYGNSIVATNISLEVSLLGKKISNKKNIEPRSYITKESSDTNLLFLEKR